ncbi:MAG TPA: hypothetical protein VF981_01440 [Gemmatimonadaceae bacterium]
MAYGWDVPPTSKARQAVQRSVNALLDELAPDKTLKRIEHLPDAIEPYRTASGCVLQAATAAVSVSWFADAGTGAPLGELHVLAWTGTVTRRGAPAVRKGATIAAEVILRAIDPPSVDYIWQAADGSRYDTAAVAAKCRALLTEHISASSASASLSSGQV